MSNYSGHNIEVAVNPFFDAWKRKSDSYGKGNGGRMMTIADVENALKMKQYQQQQAYGLPYGGNPAVPQFFQNAAAANQQHRMGARPMPEQHTQEIMRNAILLYLCTFWGKGFNDN